MESESKKIVIIGGEGRLGKSFVTACKNENMVVFVMDICEDKTWKELNVACDLFVQTNINNFESLTNAINLVSSKVDRIDAVVNTSYPKNNNFGKSSLLDTALHDFNNNINLHLGGYFHVMQKFSEIFIEQGHGNMVNIASIQGVSAPKFEHYDNTKMSSPVEYTAAKSAIIALTRYMAKYLSGKNIRVNCISPGGIVDNQPQSFRELYRSSCTSKGLLDADDLVGTLLFLLSDSSKFINGQNIIVDDGWSL